jgi:hypothetical protein
MPHFRRYSADHVQRGELLFPEWTRRPFPSSWETFEATVIEWLELVWPDWKCPHCGHQFWYVLEPVRLDSALAWPIAGGSTYGVYPVAPVACSWCKQVTPILLLPIFEPPPPSALEPKVAS